ncbi:ABC transporter permease [Spirosoma foliorum]|uniref:ABC3 transporter permease C-terminal domain-containing protein n=1 Tax=Spirosoma foliorum TaxID=2710596 RepID=A0A7G5H1D0_9BACT|nr:hypothetical protein H3H32_08495 [Spirosoma foliorum]
MTASSEVPGQEIFWTDEWQRFHQPAAEYKLCRMLAVDEDFIPTCHIKLLAGRNFDNELVLDNDAVIINQSFPGNAFDYFFLDDHFPQQYESDERVGSLLSWLAVLAIRIACLGLLGLALFTTKQRTKEIGIRKVLGASTESIVTLLAKAFLKPVGLAVLLASPLGWYAMSWWLEGFAYKTAIKWWTFVVAGGLAVSIALLTISFQSVKAALMNPVMSLRSE